VVGDDASLLAVRLERGEILVGGIPDGGAPWEFRLPLDEAQRLRDGLDRAIQVVEALQVAVSAPARRRRLGLVPTLRIVTPQAP